MDSKCPYVHALPSDPGAPVPTHRFRREFEMKYMDSDAPIVVTPVSVKLIEFFKRQESGNQRKQVPGTPQPPRVSLSERSKLGEEMFDFSCGYQRFGSSLIYFLTSLTKMLFVFFT